MSVGVRVIRAGCHCAYGDVSTAPTLPHGPSHATSCSQPEGARAELESKDTVARVCLLPACQSIVGRTGPLLPTGRYCCFPPLVQHHRSEASCHPHGGAGHVLGVPRSCPTSAKTPCCLLRAWDPGTALPDRFLQTQHWQEALVNVVCNTCQVGQWVPVHQAGFVSLGRVLPESPRHDAVPEFAC